MVTNAERKKVFFGVLTPYFKSRGYKEYLTSGDPGYVRVQKEIVITFYFNFFSNGEIGVGPLGLTNYDVEDFILDIGTPTNYVAIYKEKKKYHPATVEFRRSFESIKPRPLMSEVEVISFANAYIHYLENEGAAFIENYRYLPNILKEMDRLEKEDKYWNEILAGGPEHLFRGILISRLCNDNNYLKKLDWVGGVFKTMDLDEWQPYWEKLKDILPTIESKYNV